MITASRPKSSRFSWMVSSLKNKQTTALIIMQLATLREDVSTISNPDGRCQTKKSQNGAIKSEGGISLKHLSLIFVSASPALSGCAQLGRCVWGYGWRRAQSGAPLPSSPQLSSSHLDTMWEWGTGARGIAVGRVWAYWGILYRTSRAGGKRCCCCCCCRWSRCCCCWWMWCCRVVCVLRWWGKRGWWGSKKLPVFGLLFSV